MRTDPHKTVFVETMPDGRQITPVIQHGRVFFLPVGLYPDESGELRVFGHFHFDPMRQALVFTPDHVDDPNEAVFTLSPVTLTADGVFTLARH